MARQVLPFLGAAVGAVAGFALGGPAGAIYGAQGGFLIGTTVGNIIDPTVIQGNTIGDQTIQTASEGGARAIVYAKGCVTATCVIARGNRQVIKTQTRNGKGASSVTENQSVHWTFAIGIGEDLIGGSIRRIWQDETLVYDVRSSDKQISDADNTAYAKKFRFYDGSETQLPDPDLQTFLGDATPCYRGTAYVVFPNFDLTPTSERIPQFKFEVVKAPLVKEWQTSQQLLSGELPYTLAASDGENLALVGGASNIFLFEAVADATNVSPESVATLAGGVRIASNGEAFVIIGSDWQPWFYAPGSAPIKKQWGMDGFVPYVLGGKSGQWLVLGGDDQGREYSARSSTGVDWIINLRTSVLESVSSLIYSSVIGKWISYGYYGYSFSYDGIAWNVYGAIREMPSLSAYKFCESSSMMYAVREGWSTIIYQSQNGTDWAVFRDLRAFGIKIDAICYSDEYGLCAVMGVTGCIFTNITASSAEQLPTSIFLERGDSAALFPFGDRLIGVGNHIPSKDIVLAYKHLVSGSLADATVGGALETLADRVQVELDASAMTETCDGVVIQETTTGADAISSIAAPFFANAVEADGKLKMVRRGAAVQRVLTYDDLTEEPEVNSRENSIEYPEKLHFFYQSPTTGYATTKATSSRYSANALSSGESSVTAPVVFDSADAPANIASKLHKVMWAEAEGTFTWKVGDHNLDLVPSDCVGLYLRGISTRARITQIDYDIGKLTLTMVKDRQSAYSANVTAMPLPTPTAPPVATMSKAVLAVLDIPALLDTNDGMCYYLAMSGSSQVWTGGVAQRSMDGGSTWANVASFATDSTMGQLTQPLPAASPDVPDMTNSLTVQLFDNRNELLSVGQQAWLAEQNGIAVQCSDGSWEIMQYETATDAGNGLYTLSGLQRGRLGTSGAAHAVGALFVLLGGAMVKLDSQTSWIGQTIKHRGVSNTTSVEDADVVDTVYAGLSQRELPVAGFDAEMQGTVLNISNIVPRMRFGTEDTPVVSANWAGYRIVATGVSGVLQADTVSTGVQLDCATIGQVASVAVSQLNRLTGAGPAVTKEFQ